MQFCLSGEQGKLLLVDELKRVAAANNMEFLDSSASVDRDLRVIDAHFGYPTIHLSMQAPSGLGATAGNQGLGRYQVSIGFNGPDDQEAGSLAEQTVSVLKIHWTIIEVPKDRGAFPLPNCDAPTSPETPPNQI